MKTKPFLLATSGATVDGRNIEPDWLRQMAEDYDTKTYGARVNIEHISGVSGQPPFHAYGDLLELSVQENYEVKIGGKTEKRTALFGVLDITPEAKQLNEAGQKVFPSIEVEPNFAGKGRAYCMGIAMCDRPASIATDRLQFNRAAPGHTVVSENEDLAALLEFADEAKSGDVAGAIERGIEKLGKLFGAKPAEPEKKEPAKADPSFDGPAFLAGLQEMFSAATAEQATATKAQIDELGGKFTALEKLVNETADPNFSRRPPAAAPGGAQHRTDC